MAIVSFTEGSKDAGERDDNAQVNSIIAAVVADVDSEIIKCVLDVAQNEMAFTAEGKIIVKDEFKTKQELEEEYSMKPVSGIDRERYEQAAAMEEFVIDKTTAEVKDIVVDEDNKPTDAGLIAGCAIAAGNFIKAISQAAESVVDLGAWEGDKLGLGVAITTNEHTKDATADAEGQCEAYSTYVATIIGTDDKITANIIDCTQGIVRLDATGKITSDLATGVEIKRQKDEEYGMRVVSGIDKEWFEQIAAMEEFMIGKIADEVKGVAVDEDNKPTNADLTAGCAMSVGGFQECIVKATATIK